MTSPLRLAALAATLAAFTAGCATYTGQTSDPDDPNRTRQGALIGAAIGAINGALTAYGGLQSFIVTLAALTAVRGVALLITQGYSTPIESNFLLPLGSGKLLGIYTPTWMAVAIIIISDGKLWLMGFQCPDGHSCCREESKTLGLPISGGSFNALTGIHAVTRYRLDPSGPIPRVSMP